MFLLSFWRSSRRSAPDYLSQPHNLISNLTLFFSCHSAFQHLHISLLNTPYFCSKSPPRSVYPPKAKDAISPNFHSPSSFSLSFHFLSFSFRSLSLHSPLHTPFPIPSPKSSWGPGSAVSSPSGARVELRPQTQSDASTGLKTHLVAASFSFPQHFLWRKMCHSPRFRRPCLPNLQSTAANCQH